MGGRTSCDAACFSNIASLDIRPSTIGRPQPARAGPQITECTEEPHKCAALEEEPVAPRGPEQVVVTGEGKGFEAAPGVVEMHTAAGDDKWGVSLLAPLPQHSEPRVKIFGGVLGVTLWFVFLFIELDAAYPRANDMLAVTLLVACFWAFEVIPLEATSLLPVVLIPLSKITTSKAISASYWNWIQMMFLGAFIVDTALKHVGLHKRLAYKVLLTVGVKYPAIIVFAFMFVAFVLSMWCSNTATTIMLVPLARRVLQTAVGQDKANTCTSAQKHRFQVGVFLSIAYAATSGGIATNIGTPPNGVLLGQDILGGHVSASQWISFALPISIFLFCTIYAVIYFLFVRGIELKLDEVGLKEDYRALGPMDRDDIVVLSTQILQIVGWFLRPDVINDVFKYKTVYDDAVACAAAVALFLVPSCRHPGHAILTWDTVQADLPWGVLLLMGGGFALQKGFSESKLTNYIGEQFKEQADIGALSLTYLIVLCVCFTTEVASNTATANIMLPIFSSVSLEALVHPLALMVPATCACSLAFMLPAATPPNCVVYATRCVTMRDFLLPGFIINVISIVVGSLLIYGMASAVFDIGGPFPKYACDASKSCKWISGQACVVTARPSLCRVKDGAMFNVTSGVLASS